MKKYVVKGTKEAWYYELITYIKGDIKIKPTNDIGDNNWTLENCKSASLNYSKDKIIINIKNRNIILDISELDELDTLLRLYKSLDTNNWPQEDLKILELKEIKKIK